MSHDSLATVSLQHENANVLMAFGWNSCPVLPGWAEGFSSGSLQNLDSSSRRVPRCARWGNPRLRSGTWTWIWSSTRTTLNEEEGIALWRVIIWSEWHLKSLTWSRRVTMPLAFELQSLFWFCTEIRAAETAAAVLVLVLVQCKSAKDSCSLHTLRACCCFTHSHLHRGRHQQGGSGSHDYPSTMEISHR